MSVPSWAKRFIAVLWAGRAEILKLAQILAFVWIGYAINELAHNTYSGAGPYDSIALSLESIAHQIDRLATAVTLK